MPKGKFKSPANLSRRFTIEGFTSQAAGNSIVYPLPSMSMKNEKKATAKVQNLSGKSWDEVFREFNDEVVEWCKMYRENAQEYIRTLENQNTALTEFAERMYTLTDWHPGNSGDRIKTVMEMAHDVLFPPKP